MQAAKETTERNIEIHMRNEQAVVLQRDEQARTQEESMKRDLLNWVAEEKEAIRAHPHCLCVCFSGECR